MSEVKGFRVEHGLFGGGVSGVGSDVRGESVASESRVLQERESEGRKDAEVSLRSAGEQ